MFVCVYAHTYVRMYKYKDIQGMHLQPRADVARLGTYYPRNGGSAYYPRNAGIHPQLTIYTRTLHMRTYAPALENATHVYKQGCKRIRR